MKKKERTEGMKEEFERITNTREGGKIRKEKN